MKRRDSESTQERGGEVGKVEEREREGERE